MPYFFYIMSTFTECAVISYQLSCEILITRISMANEVAIYTSYQDINAKHTKISLDKYNQNTERTKTDKLIDPVRLKSFVTVS